MKSGIQAQGYNTMHFKYKVKYKEFRRLWSSIKIIYALNVFKYRSA